MGMSELNRLVLVVDDDPGQREQITRFLERSSIAVEEANTGEEAFELAKDYHPAVIIMDVGLPGIGGIEAANRIGALLPEAKVIMMSGFRNNLVEANRYARTAFTVIEKPVPLKILQRFVTEALMAAGH
jgi:DNA-binding NtrC family response regulator